MLASSGRTEMLKMFIYPLDSRDIFGGNPFFSPVVSKTHIFARVGQKDTLFVATVLQNCFIILISLTVNLSFLKSATNLMNARQTTLFNNKQQKSFGNRPRAKSTVLICVDIDYFF